MWGSGIDRQLGEMVHSAHRPSRQASHYWQAHQIITVSPAKSGLLDKRRLN